jgi:hypothetical protein
MRARGFEEKQMAAGLCVLCPAGVPVDGKKCCQVCIEKAKASVRRSRARARAGEPAGPQGRRGPALPPSSGHCRCGLRLPCNDCIPASAAEVETYRNEWVYPR